MTRSETVDDFELGLLLGSLFGACVAFLLILLPAVGLDVLKSYQVLVGGFIAAVCVLAAVKNTNWQIAYARRTEDERRSKDFFATRLLSSHALRQLFDYAQDCSKRFKVFISEHLVYALGQIPIPADFECPPVPKNGD